LEIQKAQGLTITKEDMAAYLGITIRSLNRALKKLK
jgi:CRP-like cAMP-binding protein